MKEYLIVIPARLHSTRLPYKALQFLGDRPMVVRVFDSIRPLVNMGAQAVVATDSRDIVSYCNAHGIPSILTYEDHPSGTDRCWEVAKHTNFEYIVNVQGDEICLSSRDVENVARSCPKDGMSTMVRVCDSEDRLRDPSVVKVDGGKFSRHGDATPFNEHLGVVAFHRNALERFINQGRTRLEMSTGIEYNRAVDIGLNIKVVSSTWCSFGVNTPEDLLRAQREFVI